MDFGRMVPPKIPEEHLIELIEAVQSIGQEEIPNQFITCLEVFNRFKIDIAVTGDSGSGKSTLINALRGLDSDAKGAAPTGVVETTMVPAIYQYPHHPSLRLYDLPGMGTPNFVSKSYVEKMNFDLYDLFIVVISERFRENNTTLIDEIQKRQKHFFVVRTKVDNELRSQSKKQNFNKNDALKIMEQDCLKYLNEKNLKSEVFLVSAHDPQNYDMPKLIDTLQKTALELKREIFISFLDSLFKGNYRKARTIKNHAFKTEKLREEDLQELEKFSRGSNFSDKTKALRIVLETLDHFQLDVAVLGETGSGGTTLINAITREQNGARVPATSPHYPHVRFWSVSGVECIMENFLMEMKEIMDPFDFYLILITGWQKTHHIELARAVRELRKHFHFVQTKIDCYLQPLADLGRPDTEILDGLRAQCAEELCKARVEESQLFLINSLDRKAVDFVSLESVLCSDLDTIKISAFAYYVAKFVKQKQPESSCQIL